MRFWFWQQFDESDSSGPPPESKRNVFVKLLKRHTDEERVTTLGQVWLEQDVRWSVFGLVWPNQVIQLLDLATPGQIFKLGPGLTGQRNLEVRSVPGLATQSERITYLGQISDTLWPNLAQVWHQDLLDWPTSAQMWYHLTRCGQTWHRSNKIWPGLA